MIERAVLRFLGSAAIVACRREAAQTWPFAVTRSSGVTILTELAEAARRFRNATLDHGVIFLRNGCLQVRTLSGVFTPALPQGSSFDPQRMELISGGHRLQLGRPYGLPYAQELGSRVGEVATAIRLPAAALRDY